MLKYHILIVSILILLFFYYKYQSNKLYVDNSTVQGLGLFTNHDLYPNDPIGLLSVVYSKNKFQDYNGRYINHSNDNNIDLYIEVKKIDDGVSGQSAQPIIYVYGKSNRYIKRRSELFADYNHKFAPKPNFLNKNNYDFMNLI
jgi:hypothetical protein